MRLRVWQWCHSDSDGENNTALYASEAAARAAVSQYVTERWNDCMDDEAMTGVPHEDVAKFFDWHVDDEWYSISSQHVTFPDIPDTQAEDVILTSNECQAIIDIIKAPGAQHFADSGLLDSVYTKLKD